MRKQTFTRRCLTGWIAALVFVSIPPVFADGVDRTCVILTGLGGQPEYEENFLSWGERIEAICQADSNTRVHRVDGRLQRRDEILTLFDAAANDLNAGAEIWVFLIGHATFDGRVYKFNIRGPDLTGRDLDAFLATLKDQKAYLVAATSSSGVLSEQLATKGRVIVTATKSAKERFPPLFMSFFVEGAQAAEADTNKDGKVSLHEVFSFSEQKVAAWYKEKGRIQTEHPLLNDSTGENVLASSAFLARPPEQSYRTLEAVELAKRRVVIEREIEALKLRKTELPTDEYYKDLERLLVELATIDAKIAELEGTQ